MLFSMVLLEVAYALFHFSAQKETIIETRSLHFTIERLAKQGELAPTEKVDGGLTK